MLFHDSCTYNLKPLHTESDVLPVVQKYLIQPRHKVGVFQMEIRLLARVEFKFRKIKKKKKSVKNA